LTVEIGGESREAMLHGRQGRLLLAYLVLHRQRPVSRDALIEAIWGHGGTPPSEGALAPVLSRLRRAVAPATIEGRDSVILRLPEPAWIDVEAAHAALDRARRGKDPHERLLDAEEAATLVEPELLPGLDAPWLGEQRVALEHVRVEALELAAAAAQAVEPSLAETYARAAVAAAPFRESTWVALIAALRVRGNVAEALQAYDEVRRLLRDELGAVPGRELVALHGTLLAEGDTDPGGAGDSNSNDGNDGNAGDVPVTAGAAARPPAPPESVTPADLVERDDEIRAVDGDGEEPCMAASGYWLTASTTSPHRAPALIRATRSYGSTSTSSWRASRSSNVSSSGGSVWLRWPVVWAAIRSPLTRAYVTAAWTCATSVATHTHAGRWSTARFHAARAAS
jgi:SARP family transcriptional regulator, regulator of embCAB operon